MFTFKKQTPEEYTSNLKEALAGRLRCVILYGSAASGEHVTGKSDYNLLVIAEKWGVLELNQFAKVTQQWLREGNPSPLLFTPYRLQQSADTFPIEMLDMKRSYKVIFGEDLLSPVKVQPIHLRLMTEREIGSLKIQLRQGFLYVNGNPKKVAELLCRTLSPCLVLFRAALRLFTDTIPAKKIETVPLIAQRMKGFDAEVFKTIHDLKYSRVPLSKVNPLNLFQRYIDSITIVGDSLDQSGKQF